MQFNIPRKFLPNRRPAPGPVRIMLALLLFLPGTGFGQGLRQGLQVVLVDRPPARNVVAAYEGYDKSGNTSVAYEDRDVYKWSGPSPYPTES